MHRLIRGAILVALVAALGPALGRAAGSSAPAPQERGLQGAAARTGRRVGVAVAYEALVREPAYARLVAAEFGAVTPENALKWAPVQPSAAVVQDEPWRAIFNAAEAAGQRVRGHTLLWDQQLPAWAVGLPDAELLAAQQRHMERILRETDGRVQVWDVVNEAIEDDGSVSKTALWRVNGERHLRDAFTLAHKLAPKAVLAYNDYGVEGVNPKSDGLLRLLTAWRAEGVPVGAVGIQSHLKVGAAVSADELATNMRRFAALGLEVHLTEIDVQVRHLGGAAWAREAAQARLLYGYTAACVAEPACRELTFWGLSDRHTWVDFAEGDDQPTLFDDALRPKLGYFAVRAALLGEPDPTCAIERWPAPRPGQPAGWSSGSGRLRIGPAPGASVALMAEGRTATWQGPVRSVADSLTTGLPLRARVRVRLDPGPSAAVALTLHMVDGAGERFLPIASGVATGDGWAVLEGVVATPVKGELQQAQLYVEGPPGGRSLWISDPSLRVDCGLTR